MLLLAKNFLKNVRQSQYLGSVGDHRLMCCIGRGLGGCSTGESKITKGHDLPACVCALILCNFDFSNPPYRKHIIHTVGPIYSDSDFELRAKQLASCYTTSLALAVENSLKQIVGNEDAGSAVADNFLFHSLFHSRLSLRYQQEFMDTLLSLRHMSL